VGVPGSEGGGDDFLDDGDGDEKDGDDFIDADGEDVTPPRQPAPSSSPAGNGGAPASSAKKRRVRVKPMPASLVQRWPGVSTMLITMSDGTQLLLVK
jgi:hypothetical protein